MKSFKTYGKIALVLLFLFAVIFGIYYYFKVIYKVEGEAQLVEMNLPGETNNIKFAFDEVKISKLKWKDALLLKGWVFKENVTSAKRDVFLVLKSKDQSLVFKIEKIIMRPDVSGGFHLVKGVDNHGFNIDIPMNRLKEDAYQVGFVIVDETGKYYTLSSSELKISDGAVTLNNSQPEADAIPKSTMVSMSLNAATGIVTYAFDKANSSGNYLIIYGWGFLQGMSSDSLKSYILLQKNGKVAIFSTVVQIRKDITTGFNKYGVNLDLSGFQANVPTTNLEKGNYRLGLYIVKGNKTGIIYSDKYLDIGK